MRAPTSSHNESGPEFGSCRIELRLLGSPEVRIQGKQVSAFRTNRVPALLALMALVPGCSRDYAASLLWPDLEPARARHNLRQTLVYVRHLLGAHCIAGDRSRLELSPQIQCDAAQILALPRGAIESEDQAEPVRMAVALYRGPLLADLHDEWLLEPRAQLSQALVELLMLLADYELGRNPAAALDYGSRAVQEEPFLDGARTRKIRALRALGEHSAAEREYRAFEKLLQNELRISPAQQVRDALSDPEPSPEPPRDAVRVPEPILSAVQELARGPRAESAVELVIALTPWLIDRQSTLEGGRLLTMALNSAQALKPRTSQLARICFVEMRASRGEIARARSDLQELLPDCTEPSVRTRCLLGLATYELYRYRPETARQYAAEAEEIAKAAQFPFEHLDAMRTLAKAALVGGDVEACETYSLAARSLAETLVDVLVSADAMQTLAWALQRKGNAAGARAATEAALARLDAETGRTAAGIRLSAVRLLEDLGDREGAEAGYERGIREARKLAGASLLPLALTYLGDLRTNQCRYAEAIELHQEAAGLRQQVGDILGEATSQRGLGRALLLDGRAEEARSALACSVQGFAHAEALPGYASSLLLLAQAERRMGRLRLALRIATRAAALLRSMSNLQRMTIGPHGHLQLQEAEHLISELQDSTGKSA